MFPFNRRPSTIIIISYMRTKRIANIIYNEAREKKNRHRVIPKHSQPFRSCLRCVQKRVITVSRNHNGKIAIRTNANRTLTEFNSIRCRTRLANNMRSYVIIYWCRDRIFRFAHDVHPAFDVRMPISWNWICLVWSTFNIPYPTQFGCLL